MKKHDYDKILFRLTSIWQRLREGEVLSVKDLSEEFNVSTKTIQRDFNEKLASKLPIEKTGHKWKAKDGFSLDKNLSFEEDLVLDILKEFSSSMGNSFASKTTGLFSKIQNQHDNTIYSKIIIDDISHKTDIIKQINDSIKNSTQVEFSYKGKYRFCEPYKIATFDGYWYLYANEVLENKFKTFHIKDIKELVETNKSFKKDEKAIQRLQSAINVWFEPNSEMFEIKLFIQNDIAKYFINRPLNKYQLVTKKYDNNDIEVSLFITSYTEILHELKKWQPSIQVIEPITLAKELISINRQAIDNQLDMII